MAEKLFYTMGEVSEMFDVNPSLLRHWETQFSVIRPKRNKKGNRLYTPQDVERLKLIYHLVKEQGMTLEGARKALRRKRPEAGADRDLELLERLQRVRALLEEVREELKADDGEIVVGVAADGARDIAAAAAPKPARRTKAVVRLAGSAARPDDETPEDGADEGVDTGARKLRRARRKKEAAESKELFAFYEQSLF